MQILEKPMEIDDIKKQMDKDGRVSGIVAIGLYNIIERDEETFLDMIGETLTGSELLMDITYKVVGHDDKNNLYIEVSGDASEILEMEYFDSEES